MVRGYNQPRAVSLTRRRGDAGFGYVTGYGFRLAWVALLLLSMAAAADLSSGLLSAAASGKTDQVSTLLAKGANVEAKDKNGRTPLMLAAQHGHADTVRLLLSKGAKADARDRSGWTAYG